MAVVAYRSEIAPQVFGSVLQRDSTPSHIQKGKRIADTLGVQGLVDLLSFLQGPKDQLPWSSQTVGSVLVFFSKAYGG